MTTIVVLVGIALQKFFHLHSVSYRHAWLSFYYRWMQSKFQTITEGHGLVGLAILAVPLLLIVSLLLAIFYHLLGGLGSFIINLALFWFCIEAPELRKQQFLEQSDFSMWFSSSYRSLFGPFFWYVLLGPLMLVFYVVINDLPRHLESSQKENSELLKYTLKIQAILDWIPVRLLGFTYALVGQFKQVLELMRHQLFSSPFVEDQAQSLTKWATAALQPESTEPKSLREEAISLIDRALLIWVILLVILTISFWLRQ